MQKYIFNLDLCGYFPSEYDNYKYIAKNILKYRIQGIEPANNS